MGKSVRELEEELERAREAEDTARKFRMASVPIKWEYAIVPVDATDKHCWDRVYDNSCKIYRLSGWIANKKEALAAGHTFYSSEGGMNFLFNTLSQKLVVAVGGGTTYVTNAFTYARLSQFIVDYPEGGDVTEIMEEGRELDKGIKDLNDELS